MVKGKYLSGPFKPVTDSRMQQTALTPRPKPNWITGYVTPGNLDSSKRVVRLGEEQRAPYLTGAVIAVDGQNQQAVKDIAKRIERGLLTDGQVEGFLGVLGDQLISDKLGTGQKVEILNGLLPHLGNSHMSLNFLYNISRLIGSKSDSDRAVPLKITLARSVSRFINWKDAIPILRQMGKDKQPAVFNAVVDELSKLNHVAISKGVPKDTARKITRLASNYADIDILELLEEYPD